MGTFLDATTGAMTQPQPDGSSCNDVSIGDRLVSRQLVASDGTVLDTWAAPDQPAVVVDIATSLGAT